MRVSGHEIGSFVCPYIFSLTHQAVFESTCLSLIADAIVPSDRVLVLCEQKTICSGDHSRSRISERLNPVAKVNLTTDFKGWGHSSTSRCASCGSPIVKKSMRWTVSGSARPVTLPAIYFLLWLISVFSIFL